MWTDSDVSTAPAGYLQPMDDVVADVPVNLAGYQLADRFRLEDGRVFLSGLQAIARLPVDQLRIDRRHGLNTAAFVSGYQGSPVGTFQEEVSRAIRAVPDLPVVVQPGVNEELAATAVMGSQLADSRPERRYDGVLGVWYGKAPGLDRASDAIRHGVFAGTAPHGGVVAVVGDDPAAKSSTLPSSSDATMVDLHMPIIFPGDVQEALDLARHAVALSRASGLWAGYKLVTSVGDGTGTVDVHPDRVVPVVPTMEYEGRTFVPHPSGRLLTPYTLDMEREFQEVRIPLAREYGVVNQLNRVTVGTAHDWLGIAACGQTYHELREALMLLGFTSDESLRRAGIRLLQLSMPVPLDDGTVRRFADGLARSARRRGEDLDARAAREERAVHVERAPRDRRAPRRSGRRARSRHRRAGRRRDAARAAGPHRGGHRRGPRGAAPPCPRAVEHPARGEPHPVLSAAAAHTTSPRGCPRGRSSAAASAATPWSR